MRRRKVLGAALAGIVLPWAILSIPLPDPPVPAGAGQEPFRWKKEWKELEASFREARAGSREDLRARIEEGFKQAGRCLDSLASAPRPDEAPTFEDLESALFKLGPLVAVDPGRLPDYLALVTKARNLLKVRSREWDLDDPRVRDRLYRLSYGGRAALEEVMLQAPADSFPALVPGDREASASPAFAYGGCELRSGDILVSRGGAPTSALIARGNDYPGNFSHVALLHVDEKTGGPSIVEAHIECGVVVTTVEEYVRDKKLRILVLRPRADLPALKADPLLPHKAAKAALEEARATRIPYDFSMDSSDPSKRFCSEVALTAYRRSGLELWKWTTSMSAPGIVKWLSCFGVTHFSTQAPADLEYDPQLTVVAEWRDPGTLWKDHVDNAILEALLDGADRGDRIPCPWWKLAPARLLKAWSSLLNLFGGIGPIPEGMSAAAAIRNTEFSALHGRMKERVLAEAAAFEGKNGYRPPYWELVPMAARAGPGRSKGP
jgi:hypothetical protein